LVDCDSCVDVNVRYNGNSLTVSNSKTKEECGEQCQSRKGECGGWSWQSGRCDIKKSSKPGDKVPSKGETTYSGGPGLKDCNSTVTAVRCRYTDNSQDVACIFPFIGENPGQKSGGSPHDSCLKTKRGVFWCATKVNKDNRVIGTSVQNRDVSCLGTRMCAGKTKTTLTTQRTTRRTTTKKTTSASRPSVGDGKVTDEELQSFSEDLLSIDDDNVADLVSFDAGCTTKVGRPRDCSPSNLITRLPDSVLKRPVYRKLEALYENYNNNVAVKEDRTRAEKAEEDALLDEIMKSKVMKKTLDFLKAQNIFTKTATDFKKLLKELWFDVYSRGNRILGSSGFEHVFLGEKKNGTVQGFHNWVYFLHLERQNQLNYLGHWQKVDLGGKGTGLAFTFKWGKEQKPYASMIIGTSPEFELSLYTTCLLVRGDKDCRISLGGKQVKVVVHVFKRPRESGTSPVPL